MDDQTDNRQPSSDNSKKIITTVAVLLVAVLLVVGVKAFSGDSATTDATTNDSTNTADKTTVSDNGDSSSTESSSDSSAYKNGEYTATGSYQSPGGNEEITVSVTLADGKITDTTATSGAKDRESKEFQSQFIEGYKNLVVGKSIDDIKLSRVSGSSLTSQGFNNAIQDPSFRSG